MYDADWYNSGDIVPDQVTPASDATPLSDGTATAGISTEYSRGDHVHPLNVTTTIPPQDSASGLVGTTNYYARNDHSHPLNITTSISPQESADGSVGTTNYYARNDHSHPINVEINASNIPIVDGVGANGTSAFYARQDHVHPQQLTYDGNVTATKFIKSGGLASEVLCANGDTTTIDSKLSRTYTGSGWIRLCVFPAGNSVCNPFIEFKIYTSYNSVQTIRLQPNYTENGITNVYGVFNAPTYIGTQYIVENGARSLFHNHSGTGTSAVYNAYIQLESVGSITIVVTDKSTYFTNRITEILTQDVVTGVSSGTVIPINYNYGYGGFMQNTLQVNPTDRSKSSFNNGIRIGNFSNEAAIYLACSNTAINTVQAGQWEISKTSDNALTINPSSLRKADHSVGLSINNDSSKITFNGNELVNVGTDQTITGRKTFGGTTLGSIQLNPTEVSYGEGIRISNSPNYNVSAIYIGTSSTSTSGEIDGQWTIIKRNAGELCICRTADQNTDNRGLMISADGNTLSFNGSVIAGAGATNGASNGSVNYSAGNPILWGVNSVGNEGGFYSDGPKIYWRAKPVTLGAVPP
ncbi:MAG: hypothetical protein EZS28_038017 [Streblomastix strix]|uniref:Uncharacterized protein n=1 Tax=Streblomastix strix TaxID=222440 RepID=A0A5J4U6I4_9EUKA|nr:MAG: hypothetical protein EZS28_038017 [Streblomastix strix]